MARTKTNTQNNTKHVKPHILYALFILISNTVLSLRLILALPGGHQCQTDFHKDNNEKANKKQELLFD